MCKLLYPSIRVRTAPPVSVRVRVRVSVSFGVTNCAYSSVGHREILISQDFSKSCKLPFAKYNTAVSS